MSQRRARFDLTRVDVEHFLEVMEVENLRRGTEEEWNFSCPFPGHQHGDTNPSAYMNDETTLWMCHGCKRSGNAISFLAEMENISFQRARSYLEGQYGAALPDPDQYSVKAELDRFFSRKEKERQPAEFDVFLDEEVNQGYLLNWSDAAMADPQEVPEFMLYMLERGFDPVTLEEWEIGYDERRERITIPVRNHEGKLVGFKGRSWNDRKPKYLVMGGDGYDYPRFHKSKIVFGLDKALDMQNTFDDSPLSSIPELIVCEGELDVISMHEKGFWNAVAVAGSDFSATQARLIRGFADSVTIFFDTNEAGHIGTLNVYESLKDFMPVKAVPDHEGDPAEMDAGVIQQTLDEAEPVARIMVLAAQLAKGQPEVDNGNR